MNRFDKKFFRISMVCAIFLFCIQPVMAMHVMEGYLPLVHCIAWSVICIPFFVMGVMKLKKTVAAHRKTLLLFAMVGAYAFVLSALKIPSVTGSSSHPTGTGLGAILFGPTPMVVVGVIVLLFQALLLAHGGLSTLGANTFSMAIAGPFLTYGIYKLCEKLNVSKKISVFFAAGLGALFTYVMTSFQLALAHPAEVGGFSASFMKFMGIFATTQIPLAVIEGLLTVIVIIGLENFAKPELNQLGYFKKVKV